MPLELNAYKVTMLFPTAANDGAPFPAEVWSWWLDSILAISHYHEFTTRGTWKGQTETHRCIVLIAAEEQLPTVEAFLHEAREKFGQEVMYFEAHPVHFKLI
jgi:hypothetical protein